MTNEPENIDDELLSAYLDNELAPEERARVEARLAGDPAARQLLDELRSVSHAVKRLPEQPLGSDIRDTVLRRAERAMLASNPGERVSAHGPSLNDVSPRFTIGRSPRGGGWGGIVTAAALAIMAFESNSNRDAQLPETVAQRDAESSGEAKPAPELRALVKSEKSDEPSAPFASPAPESPAMPQPSARASVVAKDKSALYDAQGAVAKDSQTAALARKPNASESQVTNGRQLDGFGGAAGASVSTGNITIDTAAPNSGSMDDNLLVIRVQVQPEAFKEGAFGRMLARNHIDIEESPNQSATTALAASASENVAALKSVPQPSTPSNTPAQQDNKLAVNDRLRQLDEALSNNTSAADTDLVLVEAPKKQIEAFLAEIQRDDHTYLGVAVDEAETVRKKADGAEASKSNWGQYSRSFVPQQQPLERSSNNDNTLGFEQRSNASNRDAKAASGAQQENELLQRNDDNNNAAQQHGRAVRMRSQTQSEDNIADRLGGNARALRLQARNVPQSTAGSVGREFSRAGNNDALDQKSGQQAEDTVQVLFILNSDKQPAEAPTPAETKAAK